MYKINDIMICEWLEDRLYREEKTEQDMYDLIEHYSNIKINQI